jgi:hypothetical protein
MAVFENMEDTYPKHKECHGFFLFFPQENDEDLRRRIAATPGVGVAGDGSEGRGEAVEAVETGAE